MVAKFGILLHIQNCRGFTFLKYLSQTFVKELKKNTNNSHISHDIVTIVTVLQKIITTNTVANVCLSNIVTKCCDITVM